MLLQRAGISPGTSCADTTLQSKEDGANLDGLLPTIFQKKASRDVSHGRESIEIAGIVSCWPFIQYALGIATLESSDLMAGKVNPAARRFVESRGLARFSAVL
jgi:hypothetical protein